MKKKVINILTGTTACTIALQFFFLSVYAGLPPTPVDRQSVHASRNKRIFYGNASFYADKFHGRRTANGDIFSQTKFTAACNILPLGSWIKVTNLKNNKSVIVRTTDRLHTKMRRLVDLSSCAAKKLGYTKAGLTRVKVELIDKKKKSKLSSRK